MQERVSKTRLVLTNALVFFVLFNAIYWAIPVFGSMSWIYKTTFLETLTRSIPRSYDEGDRAWVKQHWAEVNRSPGVYRSYVGWREAPMPGETITIEGPYGQRRTLNNHADAAKSVYFFGGSTMWGYGADDANTIPSHFAALTGLHVENFAEQGWVAHQSLLLLIELLQAGHRPDVVVFYDGVNDTYDRCRRELPLIPLAHQRQPEFEQVLRASVKADSFSHYLAPLVSLARRLNNQIAKPAGHWQDCDTDPGKAEGVGEAMLKDWQLAKQLVEQNGGRFLGLLQPVSTFSKTRLDHLNLSEDVAKQYRAVYPKLREKIAGQPSYYDLVPIIDRDEYIYVDWCHLSPKGNRYLAEAIAALIADR